MEQEGRWKLKNGLLMLKKGGSAMITDDNPNIMELCFHNGEQHMKEKIIEMLMDQKTKVKGVCHAHVVEIIRMVEGL